MQKKKIYIFCLKSNIAIGTTNQFLRVALIFTLLPFVRSKQTHIILSMIFLCSHCLYVCRSATHFKHKLTNIFGRFEILFLFFFARFISNGLPTDHSLFFIPLFVSSLCSWWAGEWEFSMPNVEVNRSVEIKQTRMENEWESYSLQHQKIANCYTTKTKSLRIQCTLTVNGSVVDTQRMHNRMRWNV